MRLLHTSDSRVVEDRVGDDELVVAITRPALVGLANSIGEALQAVDDWEFETRVGLSPGEARCLRDQISNALKATSRPE